MARTLIEFNGNGFWLREYKKCVLFFCLKEQMRYFYWKHRVIKISLYVNLYHHAKAYYPYCGLDFGEYLHEPQDIQYMLNIIKLARKHIKAENGVNTEGIFEALDYGCLEMDSEDILRILGVFEQLIKGKIKKDFSWTTWHSKQLI